MMWTNISGIYSQQQELSFNNLILIVRGVFHELYYLYGHFFDKSHVDLSKSNTGLYTFCTVLICVNLKKMYN